MKTSLFLGCVIPARLPFIEGSARKVLEKLNIEATHLENASCCPDPTGIPALDHKAWLALGARNLCLAENNGSKIISLCSGCVETLKSVNFFLNRDEVLKDEINHILGKIGKNFKGNVEVSHAVQLLHGKLDDIETNVKNPLNEFNVAVHYGCHFLRPSEIIQWDDPFEPKSIDDIIISLGANSIEYDAKMECCGSPLGKSDEELSNEVLYRKFESIKKSNANCITVVCPACFLQLDFGQKAINKIYNTDFNYPVFYLTELMALAFGIDEKEMGLKFHGIKPMKFLQDLNFLNVKE